MDKFFLKSKTVLGIVLAALPNLLPELGVAFSVDDATLISSTWDAIITATGAVLAVYGRFVAQGPLKVK